ncbi:MAG: zinc-dependent metalloprotease, partial [Actinomycetota bacterium]|nr:zinc-dependent metalloprotease [Actinomycetota bacterium]
IAWDLAERVAVRLAARHEAPPAYEWKTLEADFAELTVRAEELVAAETGLESLAGPARARVTDRAGWVQANIASFQRLLRPVSAKLGAQLDKSTGLVRLPTGVTQRAAGAEVGLLLGWMSGRVLGQYDQLLIEDENPEDQDMVYYVGPNVLSVEKRYGFPPREFRLWLALHEVTHRAQFTGVPWMRAHFLSLVEHTLDGLDPDPKRLLDALRRAAEGLRRGENPLDEGGLLTLLAGPEQYAAIQEIGGLMSLLEGHGDVTMDRAALDQIPNAARFAATLHERRRQRGVAKVFTSLVGLDAKMRQYEQGERFVNSVEQAGGRQLFDKVWTGPQWLPKWPEIRDPDQWIARVSAPALTA